MSTQQRVILCLLLFTVCIPASRGQTNTENFAQFSFNFNNPGARASGIGGAFVSIADDATASEANPAGLTVLLRPELSVELKAIKFKTNVNNFSHTGTDTLYTINERTFENSLFSPSFASFVYPMRRITLAVFRHELVNFESSFFTRGAYTAPLTDGTFFFPVQSKMDLMITNYGGAFAYKFNEMFSIGVSGGVSLIDMESSLKRYGLEIFTPGTLQNEATINATDNSFFVNAGIIVKPSNNFSIGAIYKKRPEFSLEHTFRFVSFPEDSVIKKNINFNVPSSFGFGVSFRPTDVFTIAVDVVRLMNSSLTKNFTITISDAFVEPKDFAVDDGMQYHVGAEYVALFRRFGLVFRGGAYVEPDNRIRWVGTVDDTNDPARTRERQFMATLFRKGESVVHYTAGIGVIVSNNFQFDVAGHLSDRTQEGILSFVWRIQ